MKISIIDIGIVISYVLFAIGLAVYYSKRASQNINEYFMSGRNLPWWVAGTSMVATTFAADTPLAITGIVAKDGISGNWLWWNGVLSGMLSTFLFARLWRRSGVITDVELAELRYDGKAASALRGFRAFYTAIPINCITMGWVLLAMQKIVVLVLGVPDTPGWKAISVLICLIFVGLYSMLSGFWGVVMTDLVQFGIAMFGSVALAIVSISKIGGIAQLKEQLAIHYSDSESLLNILPDFSVKSIMLTFGVYFGVQWWASNGVDGGGYIAQRMVCLSGRKAYSTGNLLVQYSTLYPTSLAMDHCWTRVNGSLPKFRRSGSWLSDANAGIYAGWFVRDYDDQFSCFVHVNYRHPSQLGIFLFS